MRLENITVILVHNIKIISTWFPHDFCDTENTNYYVLFIHRQNVTRERKQMFFFLYLSLRLVGQNHHVSTKNFPARMNIISISRKTMKHRIDLDKSNDRWSREKFHYYKLFQSISRSKTLTCFHIQQWWSHWILMVDSLIEKLEFWMICRNFIHRGSMFSVSSQSSCITN